MPKINTISSIPAKAVELLEAVGYLEVSDLRGADLDDLIQELKKANEILEIMASADLSAATIGQWRQWAMGEQGNSYGAKAQVDDPSALQSEDAKKSKPVKKKQAAGNQQKGTSVEKKAPKRELVNFEKDENMMQMLALSPVAEPLDAMLLAEEEIPLDDVADGVLLNQCDASAKINIMTTLGRADSLLRQDEASRTKLNASRIRNFDDLDSSVQYVKPLDRGPLKDAVVSSPDLNEGVSPKSLKFIKGVFHTDAVSVRRAALTSLIFSAVLVVNIISLLGLFLFRTRLEAGYVLTWVVSLLFVLVVSALSYFYYANKARCIVCRQPPLMPKKCIKHKKAHHVKGAGYILPTALQLLRYKWFYCTYCGTAIRLKK